MSNTSNSPLTKSSSSTASLDETYRTAAKTAPVALITGAARRIGAEIARNLHTAGFNLVLHYRHSRQEIEALQQSLNHVRENSCVLIAADLCDVNAVQELATTALTAWGRMDVLINNASSFYPTSIGDITLDAWQDLMGTNLQAPLFLSQALAPALTETEGCIINIADVHGERPLRGHTVYCLAKAGNIMLTKSLAKELGPRVRVNGIAPGAILWPEHDAELSADAKQTILDRTSLKRLGEPSDIARAIRFLILDAPYITGQIIAVDGGRNLVS